MELHKDLRCRQHVRSCLNKRNKLKTAGRRGCTRRGEAIKQLSGDICIWRGRPCICTNDVCFICLILTLVSMLILGAVSLANLMNCLGSRVLTTISPDFCTALKAAAVEES